MENKDQNSLDDLISSSGGQPIIVQDSGSDKKFLYTLLILLVLLFIIAIAVIAFLGSKYFSSNNNQANNNTTQQAQVATQSNSNANKEMVTKAVEVAKKKVVTQKAVKQEPIADENTLSELENLVKEEESKAAKVEAPKQVEKKVVAKAESKEQKVIKQVATAAGGKNLSQEDLATIAKLVAQELAKSKSSSKVAAKTTNSDQDLVASLEGAQTDTLKNEQVNTNNLKDSGVNKSAPAKKVDTFNKVVINKQNNSDDELAQLSSEIDAILQTEEVTKKEKSLKYGKELNQEITRRKKELRYIVVRQGDTLSSLAYKAYGRASAFRKIYAANPDLVKNPNRIYIGMKLRVPVDEEYIKQQGN